MHPDLRGAVIPPPIRRFTLPLIRAGIRVQALIPTQGVEVLTISAGPGIRLHQPPPGDVPAPALLWIHGGGYLFGHARQDDALCAGFARELGITVAAVDYRLAPEHAYPDALDDCYAALQWLVGLPTVDPSRVAIGGASAGGGLAATLAMRARDAGEITPVLQLLTYPMLDDRTSARPDPRRRSYGWDVRANRFGWDSYLGDAPRDVAVPARRTDLRGLPPAWIGVGDLDLFYSEDLAYAERLKAAGVKCDIEVVPGVFHGFDSIVPKAAVSRAFFEAQCAALRQAVTAQTT
ncbi:MAG TPA: alpha/beta hydrolase [Mycobacterium sp.]|nr:alpha/beta hydrolase [Mycobacterium sp.]